MQICVYDDSSPAIWVNQPNGRTAQYWSDAMDGETPPFSWGSVIWLDNARYATQYAAEYPDYIEESVPVTKFTPVSNTKTGSGTVADPIVITTTVMLGSTNVQFTQRVTYITGDRRVRKTWTLTNNGTNTYTNVRLFHGGDATFGGIDDARSWYDPVNQMVYLTNKEFDVSGYMGSYANPATPAAAYFAGFIYRLDPESTGAGYDQVLFDGQLSNVASPDYQDAGYFLQWNREALAPGDTWTVEAFDYWSPPGKLQMFAPPDDHAVPGGTLSRTFKIQNLDDTNSIAVDLQATAPGGWTVALEGDTSFTLSPLEIAEIPVSIGVPSGAAGGSTASITLTASVDGSPSASAAMRVTVIVPEYTITPSSLTFPNTLLGSTSDLEVQVANGSGAPAVTFGSTPALTAPFSILADECSDTTLAAGASCSITVRYAPTSTGSSSGTLSLSVLSPDIVVHSIPLAGSSLVSYTVTASAGTGGTISPTSTSVVHGQTATFTVTPNTGYEIASVSGCSGTLSGNTYTTGAITAACTVNATFSLKQYTVTASAGAGGSISPTSTSVTHGQTATFTITPNVGYAITSVSGCSGTLSGNTYTTGAITAACAVNATFSLNQYTVTASAGTGGTISPASTSVVHGQTATFTVTPNTGYEIASVGGCSGALSGNTYTTGAITGACAVNATFSLKQYTVTASAGAGGSISPASTSVTHGQTATFTVTPNTGYEIASVSGCSGALSGNTYTTGAITGACAVNATFSLKQYTVTASAGAGGSISPASTSVTHGQTATFTVTPNTGYEIASVSGCSGSLSGNTYTTGAITAACAVNATFTQKTYTVTASAGTGGSISPASTSVPHGQTATFTITPNAGYEIASVSGCSGTLSGNTYTTGAITAACTVSATFAQKQYTVTASAGPGGTVSPTHITVAHGESATFTATPDPDYEIASLSGCDGVRDGSKLTVVVTASCTVSASFNKIKSPLPVFKFEHTRPDGTPEPLSVASTELFTALPEIVAPKAYDAEGTELPVTLVDALDRYPPGAHVITWRTEDSQGHVATATQALYVWPTVSFGPDITIGGEAGNYAFFRVALNGRAPVYPLMVNYTAHGDLEGHDLQSGTVVFEDGEIEKEIGFAIQSTLPAGAADRQVQLTFDDGVNRGSDRPLTVTITALNAPPTVRLALSQAGKNTAVVTRDGGPATLSLDILDPNTTQTHTVQWIAPTGADFTIAANSLVLQPGSLPPGVHRFEAIVTDSGAPPAITRGQFDVVVRETTAALPAGATELLENGMPNHADYTPEPPNVLPERERELHHYLMEADPGTRLALGPYSQLRAVYQTELEGPPAPNEWPADTVPNVGGYFDFVVADLPRVGETVNVVIPQRAAIPAKAVYRKLNPATRQWQDFVQNTTNSLASAPGSPGFCPPPSSTEYRAGLNAGDWCVRLTLEDGGPNDSDAQANGSVADPGGVGVLSDPGQGANPDPDPDTNTPVVVTGHSKGGGGSLDWWTLVAALGVLALRARRQGKRLRQGLRRTLMAAALAIVSAQATAADADVADVAGWYAGVQAGAARTAVEAAELTNALRERGHSVTASIEDRTRPAWRVHGGYQWARHVAVEAGYLDLGSLKTTFVGSVPDAQRLLEDANEIHPASAEGFDLALIARYALLPRVDVHARVGVFAWDTRTQTSDSAGQRVRRDDDGVDPVIGVGAQIHLPRNWLLSCEWVRYELGDTHLGFARAGIAYYWR